MSRTIFRLLALIVVFPLAWALAAQEPVQFHRPVFLPDGRSIVVMTTIHDGDWELYRMNLDGTSAIRLTDHQGWDGYATVSSDGRSIVFDRGDEANTGMVIADIDGTYERWLVRAEPGASVGGPSFAPDAASILYRSGESGNNDVYRVWIEDGRRERITHTDRAEGDAVFSPRGDQIAYTAGLPEGGTLVELLAIESGDVREFLRSPGRLYGLAWSPDGRTLWYNDDSDGDQEIYRADLATGTVQKVTDNAVPDHLPVVSPDGAVVIYTSERTGPEEVFHLDLGTGEERRLELFPAESEPAASTAIPPGAHRIDGRGGYLMPGLIDAHVHFRDANALRSYAVSFVFVPLMLH